MAGSPGADCATIAKNGQGGWSLRYAQVTPAVSRIRGWFCRSGRAPSGGEGKHMGDGIVSDKDKGSGFEVGEIYEVVNEKRVTRRALEVRQQ
jgi:hypothetical protein